MTRSSKLRRMLEADLSLVLAWRNHSDVRRWMFTSHEIGIDEHERWFHAIVSDPARHPLIFEMDGSPQGFVQIGPVAAGGNAAWGFYLAPDAPKGCGRSLGEATLAYAFDDLGLHKLSGEVLAFNEASLKFHRHLGFREEGLMVEQHFGDGRYHDVVRFGLLAAQWRDHRAGKNA
ncbi:MAG TPA: UDP-4-amino-4,6-dideoxy-N-acetyl-beta-L-altrosamine N-acetyltransferase [Xanthomonadaceae bacterium]